MLRTKNLKEFCNMTINLLNFGYKDILVVKIPISKYKNENKRQAIYSKVSRNYQSFNTKNQVYYNKKNGYANFKVIVYLNIIIIMKSKGLIKDEIDIGNGFIPFCNKEPLEVIISDYLGVIFFVDERKKVNVRLNKTTTQSFKINITHAIVKNEGREFHNIINKFKGLPLFRGIINQKRELRKYVVAQMKSHNRKWVLPIYI
jgi:predicted site-specific integrase-resolvase